jgi:hypothetical protein
MHSSTAGPIGRPAHAQRSRRVAGCCHPAAQHASTVHTCTDLCPGKRQEGGRWVRVPHLTIAGTRVAGATQPTGEGCTCNKPLSDRQAAGVACNLSGKPGSATCRVVRGTRSGRNSYSPIGPMQLCRTDSRPHTGECDKKPATTQHYPDIYTHCHTHMHADPEAPVGQKANIVHTFTPTHPVHIKQEKAPPITTPVTAVPRDMPARHKAGVL